MPVYTSSRCNTGVRRSGITRQAWVNSEPWDRTMAIRYQDRFTREPGGWLFVERLLAIDWERETPLGPGGWA